MYFPYQKLYQYKQNPSCPGSEKYYSILESLGSETAELYIYKSAASLEQSYFTSLVAFVILNALAF